MLDKDKKKDIFLNLIARAIPVFTLQIVILPLVAGKMTSEKYGIVALYLSFFNIVPSAIGNAINNVRLIDRNNRQSNDKNSFNFVLCSISIFSMLIALIFSLYINLTFSIMDVLLVLCVVFVWIVREYHNVVFRLSIDYKAIVISNFYQSLGFVLGYFIFLLSGKWQYIYIVGYLLSLIFSVSKSDLWRESYRKNEDAFYVFRDTGLLAVSGVLGNLPIYADKLILFPFMGAEIVGMYYVATIFGKLSNMLIGPISSVMLTYLSRWTGKNNSIFRKTLFLGSISSLVGYVICLILGRPVISIIYPQYVNEVMKYLPITTATAALNGLIALIKPYIISLFDTKWMFWINLINAISCVVLSVFLLKIFGLFGFCFGVLLSSLIMFIAEIIVYCTAGTKITANIN